MAGYVVSATLKANVEGFTAGMAKAKKSVDDLTKATTPKKGDAFEKLSDKAALAGVGIASAMALATKRFADFDQSMSAVAANSGATGQELEKLRSLAVKLGADSQFSAKEAADGLNEMAKAGIATRDILGGGLKGALDLAAAGQIGVADAAETAATAMTQFKLRGSDVPHIADLLANSANKAQGGVADMAQALKQSGLVAAATGLSIEETTAGLTAFASAGLIGSDAGTSFKTMLQRLSAPTDQAAAQLKTLGISAYDQQGKFVGLANVAGQLQTAMKDLTPEQRNAAMSIIFGNDAIRAANVLYEQGATGINRWTKEVGEQGAAARQAAKLTDNLKGDVERLGGALDSVFIQTGSSANGGLRTLVQGLNGFVDAVARVPGPVLATGTALSALALLAPKGIIKFREYKSQLDSLGLSLDKITAKAPRTGAALEGAGKVAGSFVVAMTALSVAQNTFADGVDKLGVQGLVSDLTGAGDAMDKVNAKFAQTSKASTVFGDAETGIRSLGDALRYTFNPDAGANVENFFNGIGSAFGIENTGQIGTAKARITELDSALSALVSSGHADAAATRFGEIAKEANRQGISLEQLRRKFPQYGEALAGAANQSGVAAGAMGNLSKATGEASDSFAAATAEGDAAASAVLLLGKNADESSDAVKTLAQTIQSDMDGASKAFQSSFDVLGKYDPQAAADKAKAASEKVAEAEQKLADLQGRIGAKGKLTVAQQQQLSKARAKAADDSAKSTKKEGDARKALSDLEDRLAAKGSASVSDGQQLRKAREALAKARSEAAAANKQVGASGLSAMYQQAVADAQKFAANITEATKRGLDPQTVAKLLQEGPEKAAPALEALLGKNSANLIKMSNDAEGQLRRLNGVVVEQSRLTAMAVNSSTDQLGSDLSTAMAISAEKARLGGTATGQAIAKGVGASLPEVQRIAAEFGIALQIPRPTPVPITVNSDDALAKVHDFKQQLANLDGTTAHTFIDTRIATERDRRQDAANSKGLGATLSLPNQKPAFASGGYTGDGGKYEPAGIVHKGEYVFSKASVGQIGKATLDYLHQHRRMPGYATGGLVGARAQQVPMMLAPSRGSADGLGRQFVSGSLDLGNGLNGYVRAIVADEMAGKRRGEGLVQI